MGSLRCVWPTARCFGSALLRLFTYAPQYGGGATVGAFRCFHGHDLPPSAPIDGLAALSPSLLLPAHCTGWKAMQRLAARFPDTFVQSAVGSRIQLDTSPDPP